MGNYMREDKRPGRKAGLAGKRVGPDRNGPVTQVKVFRKF